MRVLVTGAGGFVGPHVIRCLMERGHEPVATVRNSEGGDGLRVDGVPVPTIRMELTEADSVRRAVADTDPGGVVHLAGRTSVALSWKEPRETMEVNALGALHLMTALRELSPAGIPRAVVLVGSGEVYGRSGTADDPLSEEDPLHPGNPYGASKGAQEMVAWAYRSPDLRIVLARSFPHTGPGQRRPFVVPDWILQLLEMGRREGTVLEVGNLDVVRDFLHVRDVAAAYVRCVECPRAGGVFNVCSGTGLALREVLGIIQQEVGVHPEVREKSSRFRPTDIPSLVGTSARLQDITGWEPRRSITEAIRELVEELKVELSASGGSAQS